MSAVFANMLRRGEVNAVVMVEIDHPSRYIYAWSGLGDLDYGGHVYEGLGLVGAVAPIRSSTEIEVSEVTFQLSGADADIIKSLSDSVKGRFAYVYEAFLDLNFRVVERELLLTCRLDHQTYRVDPDSGRADVSLVGHAGFFHLLKRSGAKMSPEEAKALDSDETGYDEMHLQQDMQLTWRPA